MGTLFIGILLLMKAAQGYFNKKASVLLGSRHQFLSFSLFNYAACAALSLLYLLAAPAGQAPGTGALAVSALGGLSMAVCSISGLAALRSGTVALGSLAAAAGLLIPCAAGTLLFGERLSPWQGGGVLMLLGAAWLLGGCSKKQYGHLSAKTVGILLVSLLSNGTTMLAQKLFSFYYPQTSTGVFSLTAFLFASAALLLCVLPQGRKAGMGSLRLDRPLWIYGLILAGALFVVNLLSTIASALVPSVVLFTLVNGGGMLLAAGIGAVFFRERLTAKSLAGVALGAMALIIINTL